MAWVHANLIQQFATRRVIVLGDLMLDRYISGRVRRISPEAPVPIVEIERTTERPGGAANVAANVHHLGAATCLIGLIGRDADGERLRQVLGEEGLSIDAVITCDHRPTTVKTRIVAHGQQIVRVDREIVRTLDEETANLVLARLHEAGDADALILSDYAKGVLSPRVCAEVIRECQRRGTPVLVDPKGRDYRRYTGATAVTPNRAEAALALGLDDPSQLRLDVAKQFFLGDLRLQAALITQGEHGMTLLQPAREPITFPATARDVADVTGAGDTAVSVFALAVAAGGTFELATVLANAAAGVVVGKAGAAAISADELLEALAPPAGKRPPRSR